MWLLTRNDSEILTTEDDWCSSCCSSPEDWRLFASPEDAMEFSKALGVAAEFVSYKHVGLLFHERYERNEEARRREEDSLRNCEYVPLRNSLKFHADTDVLDMPYGDEFNVTHYVMSKGEMLGVLGFRSKHHLLPLQSITGDDFECVFQMGYHLSKESQIREDYSIDKEAAAN